MFGNEVYVEIKNITDLVLECTCCGTDTPRPYLQLEHREVHYTGCQGHHPHLSGLLDPRETRYRTLLISHPEYGWRNTTHVNAGTVVPATLSNGVLTPIDEPLDCSASVTEGGERLDLLFRSVVQRVPTWHGDIPPSFYFDLDDLNLFTYSGIRTQAYSGPITADANRAIMKVALENTEWESPPHLLRDHHIIHDVKTTGGTVRETRYRYVIPADSVHLLWVVNVVAILTYQEFIQTTPVRWSTYTRYETRTSTVNFSFEAKPTDINESGEIITDWYYLEAMAIEAGLVLPTQAYYRINFNTSIDRELAAYIS